MAYWNGTAWVPEVFSGRTAERIARPRIWGAAVEASLIVLLAFGLVASTTFAAKPPARYSVEVENGTFAGTAQAEIYGDRTDYWLKASCYQAGSLVYEQWERADAYGHVTLTLGPTERWAGGSADCTAEAGFYGKNFRWRSVATAGFSVADQ